MVHSRAAIDAAMDDLIGRQPEGLTVIASYPDPVNNRLVLETSAPSEAFLKRVAQSYDPSMVAVRVTEGQTGGEPALGRENDSSPFYGGATVNG